jgi:hypothetical protein
VIGRREIQGTNQTARKENPTVRPLRTRALFIVLSLAGLAALLPAVASAAAPAPHWKIYSHPSPTNLPAGEAGDPETPKMYVLTITNDGDAPAGCTAAMYAGEQAHFEAEPDRYGAPQCPEDSPASNPITVTDNLPAGITALPKFVKGTEGSNVTITLHVQNEGIEEFGSPCAPGAVAICSGELPHPVYPGAHIYMTVPLEVDAGLDGSTVTNEASVAGGDAAVATVTEETLISAEAAPLGFQAMDFSLLDQSGAPEVEAGAHPNVFHIGFQLNTLNEGEQAIPVQSMKDVVTTLPRGMVLNPQATPVLCTEAELESQSPGGGCPAGSVVGLVDPTIGGLLSSATAGTAVPLYNMVPPAGAPAAFAFSPPFLEGFIHLIGGVNTAGEYTLGAVVNDLPQIGDSSGILVDFWGNPTEESRDHRRGQCYDVVHTPRDEACSSPRSEVPLLSMPSACSGPLSAKIQITSWEDQSSSYSRSAETQDSDGNPVGVTGCEALDFRPTLKARPTTNVADSPSGLEVDLNVPQTENVGTKATSTLKKATVTLPEGLVVNPSAANGLGACTPAQIGMLTPVGQANAHFSGAHASCPDAAKIGTVEVNTPLLENPLPGAVYIAQPHANPFNSLLALYIVIDDPKTGVVIKLAGHVEPDPRTGRITASFDENPELPFEDFKLHFFGGAGGTLRTPPVCGEYATDSTLSPWSGTAPVASHDPWAISQAPGGGPCAATAAERPASPSFDAGTISPVAGAYSPFVLHLNREDGSQNISALDITTPPGFTGRLAGIPYCSDSSLVAAEGKTGGEEEAHPSCPAASALGSVVAAAGAGPAPYYAKGTAYLAGPYKGAPLSMAVITPATAGPFDLGTIVIRVALRIDPASGQIHSVSDPIPQILDGIPLDLRSVTLRLDRPRFTRTGTSCNPFAVSGLIGNPLGAGTAVSSRYQLGECSSLAFKPQIGIRLTGATNRGAHPALRAVLSMPEGGANLAGASVALPHSEFLDQGHIGTVCTRVQFAAGAGNGAECPPASIYGHVVATSPLVDYQVEGPVYLRSSTHELPDLVLALHGPPAQPIAVEAAARVDSIHGGIRSTFEATPDLPLSKVVLSMAGGSKGLLQNSTDICASTNRATAKLVGQNSKVAALRPALKDAKCKKGAHKKRAKHHHRASRAAR